MYLDQCWICKMLRIVALEVLQLCTWEFIFLLQYMDISLDFDCFCF
jgi:hypothetical protein